VNISLTQSSDHGCMVQLSKSRSIRYIVGSWGEVRSHLIAQLTAVEDESEDEESDLFQPRLCMNNSCSLLSLVPT
jgi:hypothetical protein